jgi:DNA-binding transcriptional MocR family regulator
VGSGTRVSLRSPPVRAVAAVPSGLRDLASGNPDPKLLPDLRRSLEGIDAAHRLYGEPADVPELIEMAAERFRAGGVPEGRVTAVSGALDGVERVLQVHLRPGDRVAVEDPGYHSVLDLVAALGLVPESLPVDDRGPTLAGLARAVEAGVHAIVVTPRAQNPFGSSFEPDRARELRNALAGDPDVLVVEDDHAGAVAGMPLVSLVEPGRRRWAVVHSVSKSLGPDLRVAMLTGDSATLDRMVGRRLVGPGWVSGLLQQAVLRLWSDPAVEASLRDAAEVYTRRRDRLLDALAGRGIEGHGRSGMNVWVPVPEEARVIQRLLQEGWAVRAGEPFRLRTGPAVRVTTSTLEEWEADEFAEDLARALRTSSSGRSA